MAQVKPPLVMPPTAAGGVARLAVARLIADDVDPGPLLHATSIPLAQIADTRSRISAAGQVKLLTLASQALDDDLLGFRLAEHCDLRQAGLVYFVLTSSATFGDALARAERYCSINNESIVIELLHGPELRIRHRYVGVPRHKDRHHMEFWLTVLVRICQRFTDNAALPHPDLLRPSALRCVERTGSVLRTRDLFWSGARRDCLCTRCVEPSGQECRSLLERAPRPLLRDGLVPTGQRCRPAPNTRGERTRAASSPRHGPDGGGRKAARPE